MISEWAATRSSTNMSARMKYVSLYWFSALFWNVSFFSSLFISHHPPFAPRPLPYLPLAPLPLGSSSSSPLQSLCCRRCWSALVNVTWCLKVSQSVCLSWGRTWPTIPRTWTTGRTCTQSARTLPTQTHYQQKHLIKSCQRLSYL